MTGRTHQYKVHVVWTGNLGSGTSAHDAYSRRHVITALGKADILASSDPAFRGDPASWNPEDLLVASIASCHQLWYLGLRASAGVVILAYEDKAQGWMDEERGGAGQMTRVLLRPHVTLLPGSDIARARALHADAHARCFIARSVNFPVSHEPSFA